MNNKLIAQGRTAEIYEWEDGKVIKLFRKGMSKEAVESEYKISKIVQDFGLSVPAVYELLSVEDRYGIVYEKITGETMLKIMSGKLLNTTKEAHRLAELHYSMHKCEAPDMPSQKSVLRESIKRVDMLAANIKKKVLDYLDKLPEEKMLCHGDFHPDNVIVSGDRDVVIDWITGTMGTPAADVARTSILLRIGSMPPGTPFFTKLIMGFVRSKFNKEYIKRYTAISGMATEEIEAWELPVAAARLLEWLPKMEKTMLLDLVYKNLRGKKV